MHFFKSKKVIAVILTVIIVGAMSATMFLKNYKELNIVRASATDNVRGFAWSELYGWISFNSADCDIDNNGKIDSGACGGDNINTLVKDYGTKIDVITGNTTGYAWNPLLGYICVGSTCSTNSPDSVPSVASYNRLNGQLSGWANILSQGANGWIKFDNTTTPANGVFINAGTGIATGWAWNGNGDDGNVSTFDGAGWISFNCNDSGAGGCANSNYAVTANVNRPPNLSNVDVDYTGVNDPCLDGNTVTRVALKWMYDDDDNQSSYKIELSPAAAGPYTANTTDNFGYMAGLAYGTNYTYTLTVYDSGNPSLSTTTTGSFTTKPNEYPDVSFSWYAPNASAEEEIMFTGISQYYTPASPATSIACSGVSCSWQWITTDIADVINTPTASSTMITFAQMGTSDVVTFTATSTMNGLSCSTSTTMNVSEKLPDWAERGN